jgi:hypothetical protein
MAAVTETGIAINLTATGTVCANPCQLLGFYVNSTTGGTVIINDNTTALSGTITPAIGFHRFPANFGTSCKVTIANTLNVTFFVIPTAGS